MTDVPCNGCRACCINQRIILEQGETGYKRVATARGDGPVVWMLAHKRDSGECYYLGDAGCTIHGRAPKACQQFDCRTWLEKFSPEVRSGMVVDGLDGDVAWAALQRGAK